VSIPTDVRNAVVGAYYPRALSVPDSARARAQAAYGIASAIAAALVAAGVFGNLSEAARLVQALGVAALVAWLVAAGLFLVAVSAPFEAASQTQSSVEAFVNAALEAAQTERTKIDGWQTKAGVASGLAAALTVAALVAALVDTPSSTRAGTIALTTKGQAAVAAACGKMSTKITGSVSPDDLEKNFVSLTLDKGVCGGKSLVVSVPRGQIQAVAFNP
jgi:MFS family permease